MRREAKNDVVVVVAIAIAIGIAIAIAIGASSFPLLFLTTHY